MKHCKVVVSLWIIMVTKYVSASSGVKWIAWEAGKNIHKPQLLPQTPPLCCQILLCATEVTCDQQFLTFTDCHDLIGRRR